MNDVAEIRAKVEAELLVALKENQLVMFYQPVLDLRSNQITHAEALIRWQHPVKGMVPPDDFIPVAEQCGLIIPLGEWVASEVCRQMEIWRQTHEDHLQVFLNVSPIQLMHANLDRHFAQALGKYHVPPGRIGIEITENVLIEGPEKIKLVLDRLKDMGLDFLLDDFGTGFSSMRYLRKLPFDGLKIDRAFVDEVDQNHEKAVLVKAMIVMAHSLSLTVVAEGVERQEELDFLREHDCDFVQGYLLGKPMPAEQFFEVLQQNDKVK
ncbi:MAG: EAL domain-containing protein [Mariprofundaceae bacterium]